MKALKSLTIALVCLVGVSTSGLHAATNPVVAEMALAADTFLAALDGWQKKIATFEFKDDERHNWHFIPRDRKGLAWNQMTGEQKQLAHALLGTSTSHRGHLKSVAIMSLEKILQVGEGPDRRFSRDPELYHVSVFGEPSPQGTWGWRIEGHHLSLNFTIIKGKRFVQTQCVALPDTGNIDLKFAPEPVDRCKLRMRDRAPDKEVFKNELVLSSMFGK